VREAVTFCGTPAEYEEARTKTSAAATSTVEA
jgi:hypothetical protein